VAAAQHLAAADLDAVERAVTALEAALLAASPDVPSRSAQPA